MQCLFGIYLKFVLVQCISLYNSLWLIAIVDICFLLVHILSLVPLFLLEGKHIDIALGFNIVKITALLAQLLFVNRLLTKNSKQTAKTVTMRRNNCLYFYITQIAILIVSTVYDFSLAFTTCDAKVQLQWLVCKKRFTLSILLEIIGY